MKVIKEQAFNIDRQTLRLLLGNHCAQNNYFLIRNSSLRYFLITRN
jgi:hypothetical protein